MWSSAPFSEATGRALSAPVEETSGIVYNI